MKITKYLSFAALAGAVLISGCNKDDDYSSQNDRPADAVRINFSVGNSNPLTRSNPLGDADAQAKFSAGDQISVSVTAPTEQDAVTYELGADGTTWTEQEGFLRWKSNTQNFKAVYPASAKDGFTLPTDQSDDDKIAEADYMTVEQEIGRPTNDTYISLALKRQTARIVVSISEYGDEYTTEAQRSVTDLTINGITPFKNEGIYYALILPNEVADDFITLTDGKGNALAVKKADLTGTFEAGKSYSYNLKVGKNGIKIATVTVSNWTEGTIEGGKALAEGEVAEGGNTIDLSTITADYEAPDGTILTGTLGANVKISIAPGATVTLKNLTINGTDNYGCQWAGITCDGDATIILEGDNTVKGFYAYYPGIYIALGHTLTISGTGKLDASSNGNGAGIGGGVQTDCGNIVINSGEINATGGYYAAGIGGGDDHSCGYITINGGNIIATGGSYAAGIGSGPYAYCYNITISGGTITATGGVYAAGIGTGFYGSCGNITISGGTITATKGEDSPNSIGAGNGGTCTSVYKDPSATITEQ